MLLLFKNQILNEFFAMAENAHNMSPLTRFISSGPPRLFDGLTPLSSDFALCPSPEIYSVSAAKFHTVLKGLISCTYDMIAKFAQVNAQANTQPGQMTH